MGNVWKGAVQSSVLVRSMSPEYISILAPKFQECYSSANKAKHNVSLSKRLASSNVNPHFLPLAIVVIKMKSKEPLTVAGQQAGAGLSTCLLVRSRIPKTKY